MIRSTPLEGQTPKIPLIRPWLDQVGLGRGQNSSLEQDAEHFVCEVDWWLRLDSAGPSAAFGLPQLENN